MEDRGIREGGGGRGMEYRGVTPTFLAWNYLHLPQVFCYRFGIDSMRLTF